MLYTYRAELGGDDGVGDDRMHPTSDMTDSHRHKYRCVLRYYPNDDLLRLACNFYEDNDFYRIVDHEYEYAIVYLLE